MTFRIHKGDRCEVTVKGGVKHRGEVKFIGETAFKENQLWIGIQLDEPFGKNDGSEMRFISRKLVQGTPKMFCLLFFEFLFF